MYSKEAVQETWVLMKKLLIILQVYITLSSSIGTTILVGFRPAQLSLIILNRKVLQSAVASGTSNPQLGGEPGI
jgi:hypothetical protein